MRVEACAVLVRVVGARGTAQAAISVVREEEQGKESFSYFKFLPSAEARRLYLWWGLQVQVFTNSSLDNCKRV
jgi:hypothetical protein